jgi:hypothetical protein
MQESDDFFMIVSVIYLDMKSIKVQFCSFAILTTDEKIILKIVDWYLQALSQAGQKDKKVLTYISACWQK